jgi:hypothetical protein
MGVINVNFDHIIKYLTGSVSKTTLGFLLCISAPLAMGTVFARINRKPPNWREGGKRGRLLAQYAGLAYLIYAVFWEADFSALEKLGLIGLFSPIWIIFCYMVFEVAVLFQERMSHVSDGIDFDYKTAILNIMTNSWLLLIRPVVFIVSWFSSGYTKSNSHPPTKSQKKP